MHSSSIADNNRNNFTPHTSNGECIMYKRWQYMIMLRWQSSFEYNFQNVLPYNLKYSSSFHVGCRRRCQSAKVLFCETPWNEQIHTDNTDSQKIENEIERSKQYTIVECWIWVMTFMNVLVSGCPMPGGLWILKNVVTGPGTVKIKNKKVVFLSSFAFLGP